MLGASKQRQKSPPPKEKHVGGAASQGGETCTFTSAGTGEGPNADTLASPMALHHQRLRTVPTEGHGAAWNWGCPEEGIRATRGDLHPASWVPSSLTHDNLHSTSINPRTHSLPRRGGGQKETGVRRLRNGPSTTSSWLPGSLAGGQGGPDNATLSRAQPIDAHWGIGRLVGPARGRGLPFHDGGVR